MSVKKVAAQLGVNKSTVGYQLKKYRSQGNKIVHRLPGSGRKMSDVVQEICEYIKRKDVL
jgi:transposase